MKRLISIFSILLIPLISFPQSELPNNFYSPSGKWMIKEASADSPESKELFVPSFVSSLNPFLFRPGIGYQLLLFSQTRKDLYKDLFTELMLQTSSQDLSFEYEVSKNISKGVKLSGGALKVLREMKVIPKNSQVFKQLPSALKAVGLVFSVDAKVQEAGADAVALYASLSSFREARYEILKEMILSSANPDAEMLAGLEEAHNELLKLKDLELDAIKKQQTSSAFLSGTAEGLVKSFIGSQFGVIVSTIVGGGAIGASLAVALPMAWLEGLTRGFAAEKSEAYIILLSTIDRSVFENADKGTSLADSYTRLQLRTQLSFMIKLAAIEYNSKSSGMAKDKQALRTWISGFPYFDQQEFVKAKQLAINDIDISMPQSTKSSDSFIGIILDSSGSMGENDPGDVRKKSAMSIIDQLSGNEFVFIVDFDDQNVWLNPADWKDWDKNQIKNYISTVNSSGGTNVGGGLNAMKNALLQTHSESITGYVILLTDGLGNYSNEADWFAMNGIKIYTVSYKDKADATLMSHIAGTTNGVYIQADDENDVIVAFSQFLDDLKGYNKYLSWNGTMGGKNVCELPRFFVDNNSTLLTGKLNWVTDPLDMVIISPSGVIYSYKPYSGSNQSNDKWSTEYMIFPSDLKGGPRSNEIHIEGAGPVTSITDGIEWIRGDSYTIVRITRPEAGEWRSKIITRDGSVSNEAFVFEASGSSDLSVKLTENNTGSTYNFSLAGETSRLDLKNSKAEISVTSPSGKVTDLSKGYKYGSFSFYPMDGKGNYKISVMFHFYDLSGNRVDRYFMRSKLIGEILPGYIAPVRETMGSFVITGQGTSTGNRAGIKCIVYSPGMSASSPKANGVVTHVNDRECTIRITDIRGGRIEPGDMVELDIKQWQNDNN